MNTHFYHTIELPDGALLEGDYDLREISKRVFIPEDMSGMTALDVGSSSGFWAFEMERRGAVVTAIDVAIEDQDIYAEVVKEDALDDAAFFGIQSETMTERGCVSSFQVAKKLLRSKVEHKRQSIYELSPETNGFFDFIFCGSLLMHLSDPYMAIRSIRSVATRCMIISCTIIHDDDPRPMMIYRLNPLSVWTPNTACLVAMMNDAGFRVERMRKEILINRRLNINVPHVFIEAIVDS